MNVNFLVCLSLIVVVEFAQAQSSGNFKLMSTAFEEGKVIPVKYTCDGSNLSPPLTWTGVPAGTQSFALRHGRS